MLCCLNNENCYSNNVTKQTPYSLGQFTEHMESKNNEPKLWTQLSMNPKCNGPKYLKIVSSKIKGKDKVDFHSFLKRKDLSMLGFWNKTWSSFVEGIPHFLISLLWSRSVRYAMRCSFGSFLAPHFVRWFSQNCNCTVPYFCGHMYDTVKCGAVWSLAKTITASHLIFAVTCAVQCIRCGLNDLKSIYFSNFGLFLPSPKLIVSFILGQVLNY